MRILQPKDWMKPKGYSNGIEASGKTIFVAGQIGWTSEQKIISSDFAAQTRQALLNIKSILAEANAKTSDIVRLTWFVTNKKEYVAAQKEIGEAYREVIGNHYPAMSLFEVKGLLEDDAKIEIEATAVIGV